MKTMKVGKYKYPVPACKQMDCFWAFQPVTGITCFKRYLEIYGVRSYDIHPCTKCLRNKKWIIKSLKDNKTKVTKKQIISVQDIA
ncbi:MAG: hypothetical protein A2206_01385 [Candidatus Magasanikbacteria bacterium RIFOXYA1_FULL_40_8]|uniref:Uncharacterized protein n=1 Tax=Candidatus Magasanikbacteria bacterium RIFOXYA1_FULL_40_8 TaxID=1798694 RepID=A0A1F6NTX8_9BACT|nr:MAG: hypothetical protein A2206_01385 [Candidatus Magasanikbacteria bacterium RIFOXYA1_FULL_40_8]